VTSRFDIRLILLAGLFLSAGCAPSKKPESAVRTVQAARATPFKGENCARCHGDIRDAARKAPAVFPASSRPRRRVVVIGGGMAGLSAAHFLKKFDPLVLEKEDKAGGHARREFYPNGPYPVAAVYLDKPAGIVKELIDDLKLDPSPIHAPAETLRYGNQAIAEFVSDGVGEFPADVRPAMEKFSAALKDVSKENLAIPIQSADPAVLEKYDALTFQEYLEKFGPLPSSLGDMFAKDMFGAGSADISAYMGLLYIMDMIKPSGYSWPGGLGFVSEALAKELGPDVETGALVVATKQTPDGVEINYVKDGAHRTVLADAVVFATHGLITQRIAKDLSEEKKAAMAKIKYSTYVTVSLSFREKVWEQGYSLWSADSYFTDITFASQNNSHFPGTDQMPGQIGVAYCPLGERHHDARYYLLDTDDAQIIDRVKADLEKVLPGSVAKLQDARVVRWGHAMPVMGPHYFRDIRPVIAKPENRYFFAGEDTQVPALEGAVYSAYYASKDLAAFLDGGARR
jgi:protoporphyrinogen oxidase